MRVALLVVLATLALSTPALAVTLTTPEGGPAGDPWQLWADQSRAPLPPGDITFTPGPGGPCSEAASGCALWLDNTGDVYGAASIWVTPNGDLGDDERHVLLHELGHIFDARVMTDTARLAWKRATLDWSPGWMVTREDGSRMCNLSCERFAEGASMCALYGPYISHGVRGEYGYVAGPVRQRRACRVLRMAAAGVYG